MTCSAIVCGMSNRFATPEVLLQSQSFAHDCDLCGSARTFSHFSEQQSCLHGILAKPQDAYAGVGPCPSHEQEANWGDGLVKNKQPAT